MTDIASVEESFTNKHLFTQALTHKSWVNEHSEERQSNERLEFLGDAVLEFIISKELYKRFPDKEEGYLTTLRASLVNTENLARVAEKMGVGEKIFLSKGEEEGGGRKNPSLLADTVEAIIGALYLDKGLDAADEFIKENLVVEIPQKISEPLKDAKSRLQELVQSKKLPTPHYRVVSQEGPDHDKKFVVEVIVEGRKLGEGEGKSKAYAEQAAAEDALKRDSL